MDNKQIQLLKSHTRKLHIKLELLNREDEVIDELSGIITDGSISLDSESTVRRQCSVTMLLNESLHFELEEQGKIWLDKKFKLYIGLEDCMTNEISWFNKGYYFFDKPELKMALDSKTLSFSGLDKFCLLDNEYGGCLGYKTKINARTPLFEAVKNLITLGGETKYVINDTEEFEIPYDIDNESTESIADMLKKIQELYMGFEMFYDEDGYFIFQKIKNRKFDMIEWDFAEEKDLMVANYDNSPNWQNIKNSIIIWGREFENKDQIKFNKKRENGIFGTKAIGERLSVISDDKIQTLEQAKSRADYELYMHSNFAENIKFDVVPIYGLDINKMVRVKKDELNIDGNYLISKVQIPLDSQNLMNIEANKVYYDEE